VQGERRDPPIELGQAERDADRLGVAHEVAVRQADEFGATGRPGRTHEERQIGMQLGSTSPGRLDRERLAARFDDGTDVPGRRQSIGMVPDEQRHVLARQQREVGDDELDRAIAGQCHHRSRRELEVGHPAPHPIT